MTPLLGAAFAAQLALILSRGGVVRLERPGAWQVIAGLGLAALVGALALTGPGRLARLRLPLLVVAYLVVGAWAIREVPEPDIDVHVLHREALQALGGGRNPYAISFPNIYPHTEYYAPGVVVDGRVQVGHVYPPLSLLVAGAGHLATGDYRFANLAAVALTGGLLGTWGTAGLLAAGLVLFTPRGFWVLEHGWTEPHVVVLLAATAWCAARRPAWLALPLGLFFAAKQYAVLAAPLVVLLHAGPAPWRDTIRTLGGAAGLALAVTLPFAVVDLPAFTHSVITFQLNQPFRLDALNYPAWWAARTGQVLPTWLGFALLVPVVALLLARAPRTPAGFAAAVALTLLTVFVFSKRAFANYGFCVIGALGTALAAVRRPTQ
jgi:hypothetical protein